MQIHELNTLGVTPGGTDYLAIDTGFDTAKISATDLLKPVKEQADQKVNLPKDENNQPDNGTAGQLLRTNGDGSTDWVDEGLPTDAQTAQAVSDWLDAHPDATTTVADGSLTEAKFTDGLKDKTIKDYVTPQMFGAVADANYYNAGAWYKDAGFTEPATDNTTAFQDAIDSGYPVGVPVGSYFLSNEIRITASGTTLFGFGSEETYSALRFSGTNAIVIASGIRLVTVEGLHLHNDLYTNAAIEISKQPESNDGSCHYITLRNLLTVNFKYGIIAGGYSSSEAKDNYSYLWNCSFIDLKISTFDSSGDSYGTKLFYNGASNFGLRFERVYYNGYKYLVHADGSGMEFDACNFGLNAVNAFSLSTVSYALFTNCNFECDKKVTGSVNTALLYLTTKAVFERCSFVPWTDANISFLHGGADAEYIFIGCRTRGKTGDEMVYFFAQALSSGQGSIVYAGGNYLMPRPTPYKPRKLQLLDLERSILPIKDGEITITAVESIGATRFDATERVGGRPSWYDGASWRGAAGGEWSYLDAVAASGTKTYTLAQYDDRPRTALVTVRGHQNDCYAIGLICKYRGNSLATLVPMYSNKCSIAVSGDTVTITNTSTATQYMYISVLDLM